MLISTWPHELRHIFPLFLSLISNHSPLFPLSPASPRLSHLSPSCLSFFLSLPYLAPISHFSHSSLSNPTSIFSSHLSSCISHMSPLSHALDTSQTHHSPLSSTTPISSIVDNYNSVFTSLLDKHVPLKTDYVVPRDLHPWMPEEIMSARREKRKGER